MKLKHLVTVSCLAAAIFGCTRPTHDFTPLKRSVDNAIPLGSTPERAVVVLDSLRIPHGEFDPNQRSLIGSLREPDPGMIFGTLRVVLTYDARRRLVNREIRVVLTGP